MKILFSTKNKYKNEEKKLKTSIKIRIFYWRKTWRGNTKKTKLYEKCFSWIIGQYYIKDRSLHKHIMIMKWSVCVDSQFIGNSKKWLIRTKDKWIKHEIHKNDRNWNIHGALTRTSGKNNIFWLTTLVSNVHIFWAVLLFFIITLARDDFPEQTANSAQTQVWLPKNAWFGCNLITFSVVPVVMLTEFYIIQGLLAFVLFVWSAIKTHTKKNKRAVLYCVVLCSVHVSVKLFSNDINEIYVTDELGCGHCSSLKE